MDDEHETPTFGKLLNYLVIEEVFNSDDLALITNSDNVVNWFESSDKIDISCLTSDAVCFAFLGISRTRSSQEFYSFNTDEAVTFPTLRIVFPPSLHVYQINGGSEVDDVSSSTPLRSPPHLFPCVVKMHLPSNSSSASLTPSSSCDFVCVYGGSTLAPMQSVCVRALTTGVNVFFLDIPLQLGTHAVYASCFNSSAIDSTGSSVASNVAYVSSPLGSDAVVVEIIGNLRSLHPGAVGQNGVADYSNNTVVWPVDTLETQETGSPRAPAVEVSAPVRVGLIAGLGLGGAELLTVDECRALSGTAVSVTVLLTSTPAATLLPDESTLGCLRGCSGGVEPAVLSFDSVVLCEGLGNPSSDALEGCIQTVRSLPSRHTRENVDLLPNGCVTVSCLMAARSSGCDTIVGRARCDDDFFGLLLSVMLHELRNARTWGDVSDGTKDATRPMREAISELDVVSAQYSISVFVEIVMHLCRLGRSTAADCSAMKSKRTAFNLELTILPNAASLSPTFQFSHVPDGITYTSRFVRDHFNTIQLLQKGKQHSTCAPTTLERTIYPIAIHSPEAASSLEAADFYTLSNPSSPSRPLRVALVCRLSTEKSPAFFIAAIVEVLEALRADASPQLSPSSFAPIEAYVLGDGPLRSALERVVSQLGLSSVITFVGSVPHRDVVPLLAEFAVDVLVCPGYETFGRVVVEAMAAGIVPVVCRGGAKEEIVDDSIDGIVVDCADFDKGSTAVGRALIDIARKIKGGGESVIDDMKRNAIFKATTRFSSAVFSASYLEMYMAVAASENRAVSNCS